MARLKLETERLELVAYDEELSEAHARGLDALGSVLGISFPDPYMVESEAGSWQESAKRYREWPCLVGWCGWIAIDKGSRQAAGYLGFYGRTNMAGQVEVGYEMAPAWRGQGLATEGLLCLIEWIFRKPGVKAVFARSDEDNEASRRVLEKCGFVLVGKQQYVEYRLGTLEETIRESPRITVGPFREPAPVSSLANFWQKIWASREPDASSHERERAWHFDSNGVTYVEGEKQERYPYSALFEVCFHPRGIIFRGGESSMNIPTRALAAGQAHRVRELLLDRQVDVRTVKG